MAAVFDFDDGFTNRAIASIDSGLETIEVAATTLGPTAAVAQLQRAERRLHGLRMKIIAEHITADGDTTQADKLLKDPKSSRGNKKKEIDRAKTISHNAALGDKLANDDLSEEQLDLIADASNKSEGAAATDTDLINDIANTDPIAGRAIKDDWLAKRATANSTQTEHNRQRALRRTQTFTSKKTGLDVTMVEGDGITQQAIKQAIRARSNEIFKRDGGRDLPNHQHPRTRAQREYDAAYELICGVTTRPDGSHHTPENNSDIENPDPTPTTSTGSSRPSVVIELTLDKFIGNDPAKVARQIGLGVIPDTVLADYAEHADIYTALFDHHGEPLWLARMRRNATNTQYIALVLRDRGCIHCGAAASECDVHHRIPWNSPLKGQTNLDNLVLLCRGCHTRLHANKQTLYRDTQSRNWQTRPATPNELPPPHPTHPPPQPE